MFYDVGFSASNSPESLQSFNCLICYFTHNSQFDCILFNFYPMICILYMLCTLHTDYTGAALHTILLDRYGLSVSCLTNCTVHTIPYMIHSVPISEMCPESPQDSPYPYTGSKLKTPPTQFRSWHLTGLADLNVTIPLPYRTRILHYLQLFR